MARARRIIKQLLYYHQKRNWISTTGLRQVVNNNYPLWLRGVWLIVFITSLILCSYQTYNRIRHYLSYPIAVDVRIVEVHRFPSFTVCSQDTQEVIDFKQNHSLKNNIMNQFSCMNQILYLMTEIENISVGDLWNLINTSKVVTTAVLKRLNSTTPIKPKHIISPMGICSAFHLDEKMKHPTSTQFIFKLAKLPGGCATSLISGCAHEPGQHAVDVRNLFGFSPFQLFYVTLQYKRYIFLNSPRNPCVDHKTFDKCQRKCLLNKYIKQNFPCRFPFMPSELNLNLCITKKDVIKELYINATNIFISTNPTAECNCLRRCYKIVFEFSLTNNDVNQNDTTFVLFLRNKHIISAEERTAYDFISLLADFGGNLGLYFGLSILSIIYYVQQYIESIDAIIKVKYLQRKHPKPVKYLSKIFNRQMKKIEMDELYRHKFQGIFHSILSIFLLIILISLLTIRISYYISEPTRVVIKVVENATMRFPSFTLCDESRNYTKVRKKMYKHLARNYQYCKISDWDFFDKNMTAEEIWAFKDITSTIFNDTIRLSKEKIGLTLLAPEKQTLVNTPTGQCSHFKIGKHRYVGTATLFGLMVQQKQCQPTAIAYLTPDGVEPNIIYQIPVIVGGIAAIFLSAKEVNYYNSSKSPCVTRESAKNCENSCLKSRLNNVLQCRLPYIKNVYNPPKPMCNSSKSARSAHSTYVKFFLNKISCNCTRRCTNNIVYTNLYFEPREDPISIYATNFIHNTIEYINELPHYTYIQLLCDVGAILSLTLGLCIPVMFLAVQNITFSTYSKICKSIKQFY